MWSGTETEREREVAKYQRRVPGRKFLLQTFPRVSHLTISPSPLVACCARARGLPLPLLLLLLGSSLLSPDHGSGDARHDEGLNAVAIDRLSVHRHGAAGRRERREAKPSDGNDVDSRG